MNTKLFKIVELLLLFVAVPLSFLLDYPLEYKGALIVASIAYTIIYLLVVDKVRFHIGEGINWPLFVKETAVIFLVLAIASFSYMYIESPEFLFNPVLNNPQQWLIVLLAYSVLSVYPQELAFRTFFFHRYEDLISNKYLMITLNAVLFSVAHIFLGSLLVLVITFIGGLIFAANYGRTRSTLLVSFEHILYGCWIYTIGMGAMFGFPS